MLIEQLNVDQGENSSMNRKFISFMYFDVFCCVFISIDQLGVVGRFTTEFYDMKIM